MNQLTFFSVPDSAWLLKSPFNPIREFAKHGSGFVGGKKRIIEYFSSNKNQKERALFLKNEYGTGGFGFATKEKFIIHEGWSDSKGCSCEYLNEENENIVVKFSYQLLAKEIDILIQNDMYI